MAQAAAPARPTAHTAGHRRRRRRPGGRRHRRRGGASRRMAGRRVRRGRARRTRSRRRPSTTAAELREDDPLGAASRPRRPDGARGDRRRRPARGGRDRAGRRAADRRLRARLHALDGLLDLPAPDPRRRAGHRERAPSRRPAGLLRPARPRRLRPRALRATRRSSSSPATSRRCWSPGCRRGPGRARRALDGRDDDHGAGGAAPGAVRHQGGRRRADLDVQRQPGGPELRYAGTAHPRPGRGLPGGGLDDAPPAGFAERTRRVAADVVSAATRSLSFASATSTARWSTTSTR